MPAVNPTKPFTLLTIAGTIYSLLFDFESVAKAEELLDRSLLTGLRQRDINSPSITMVRAMLYACLRVHHPRLTFDEVKVLVDRKNIVGVWHKVLEAWTAGLAEPGEDPDADEEEKNPLKSQN
jgi:hypothetical protein